MNLLLITEEVALRLFATVGRYIHIHIFFKPPDSFACLTNRSLMTTMDYLQHGYHVHDDVTQITTVYRTGVLASAFKCKESLLAVVHIGTVCPRVS